MAALAQKDMARRGQPFGQPHALGHDFVDGNAASLHARAGVGQAQQLQRALHGAVFAVAAMQGDEAAGKAFAPQLAQVALCGVERVGVHAARAQRLQNALS